MSSEFTFGDNSDKSSIFLKNFFMNLVHRASDHSDTDTVTTVHSHNKLTGADKGNPTV